MNDRDRLLARALPAHHQPFPCSTSVLAAINLCGQDSGPICSPSHVLQTPAAPLPLSPHRRDQLINSTAPESSQLSLGRAGRRREIPLLWERDRQQSLEVKGLVLFWFCLFFNCFARFLQASYQ